LLDLDDAIDNSIGLKKKNSDNNHEEPLKSHEPIAQALSSDNANTPESPKKDDKGEYYERLARVSADFDNYRKRVLRDKEEWHKYGAEGFIKALLPTLDNLERAIKQLPDSPELAPFTQGLKMVLDQMLRNMQSFGVKPFDPKGEPFDPLIHEAITTKVSANQPPNTVLEVHHKGFKLWDRLLRPARVTVAVADNSASTSKSDPPTPTPTNDMANDNINDIKDSGGDA